MCEGETLGMPQPRFTLSDILEQTGIPLDELSQRISTRLQQAELDPVAGDLKGNLLELAESVAKEWQAARQNTSSRHSGSPGTEHHLRPAINSLPKLSEEHLRKLTPRQRQLLELRISERLTSAQIAERQNLPLTTVQSDLRQAYGHLCLQLTRTQQ